jgi:hypothetical protein
MKMSKLKQMKMPVEPEMDLSELESESPESDEPVPGSEDEAEMADESAEPSMPLSKYSDDELVAEVMKRGLADELDEEAPVAEVDEEV